MGFKIEKTKDYFLLDTDVENIFINEYMATAPGEYVKVYLFARMYAGLDTNIGNEDIAKHLNMEFGDVLKAWTYWESMGVIKKHLKDVDQNTNYDVEFVMLKEQLYGEKEKKWSHGHERTAQYSMADKEIKGMFNAIEQVTGLISGTEMMEVISWINDYNATPEIIAYAYAYCYKKKKKSINYIGAVVKGWISEGLHDVVAVEKHLSEDEKKLHRYRRIFKALGFSRNPTEEEKRIIDTWFENMGYSVEKVIAACNKTSGISNPSINYVNKVLENWYKENKSEKSGKRKDVSNREVEEYYNSLRDQEEKKAELRRQEVYEKVPRIQEIERELNDSSRNISRLLVSDASDKRKAIEEIKKKIESLNTEKAFLLTDNGFELNYMEIVYKCEKCKDTGMTETGERCQCINDITKEKINLTKSM